MNWQNHCGINTSPITVAVKFKIPLIIWGEIPFDISGMFSPDDLLHFAQYFEGSPISFDHSLEGLIRLHFGHSSQLGNLFVLIR